MPLPIKLSWPPRWLIILLIIFLPILLGLAYWQLQRGLYKQSMLDAYTVSQTTLDFLGNPSLPMAPYQPIRMKGHFQTQYQFLLDNQMHEGRAGFHILVPFALESNGEWVLVNLGWLPRHAKRLELPAIPTIPPTLETITGRSYFPSEKHLLLGTHLEKITATETIIQTIDFPKLEAFLHHPLLPLVMLADPTPNSGFIRDWQPAKTLPPEKHYGYALQWLLLAITLVILSVIIGRSEKK